MRRFLLVAHDSRTDGTFPLEDLPGAGGRMDLVARCVVASLLVSHGVRSDTEFLAVMLGPPRPPRAVRIAGQEVRGLNPDERSTGALLRKALAGEGVAEHVVHPGIYASGRGLEDVLASLPQPLLLLEEGGRDLREASLPAGATFVLSDHRDFTAKERTAIRARAADAVSVGPRSLQADQVIAIVHNELDHRA